MATVKVSTELRQKLKQRKKAQAEIELFITCADQALSHFKGSRGTRIKHLLTGLLFLCEKKSLDLEESLVEAYCEHDGIIEDANIRA